MIDLSPAPVPPLDAAWISSQRDTLVSTFSAPRRHPRRWAGLVGATGMAVTISTLLLVGGGQTSAFAGWSASPTPPAAGQLASAETTCQARLAQAAQMRPTNRGPAPGAAPYEVALSDVRGPYTLSVLEDGSPGAALCISAPNATSLRWVVTSGAAPGPGTLAVDHVGLLARDGQPYTLVEGRTGAGVAGVTLLLADASQVVATVGDGLWVAWWPGAQGITSAAVAGPDGVSTQPLGLSGPPSPSKIPPQRGDHSSCTPSPAVACSGS